MYVVSQVTLMLKYIRRETKRLGVKFLGKIMIADWRGSTTFLKQGRYN